MDPGRASKHGKPPDVESDGSAACSKTSERRKVAHTSRASWEMERKRDIDSCNQHGRPWRENANPSRRSRGTGPYARQKEESVAIMGLVIMYTPRPYDPKLWP